VVNKSTFQVILRLWQPTVSVDTGTVKCTFPFSVLPSPASHLVTNVPSPCAVLTGSSSTLDAALTTVVESPPVTRLIDAGTTGFADSEVDTVSPLLSCMLEDGNETVPSSSEIKLLTSAVTSHPSPDPLRSVTWI